MLTYQSRGRRHDQDAHGKMEGVKVKQTIKTLWNRWLRLSVRRRIIITTLGILVVGYGVIFGIPKSLTFAYSGQDCARQLTLLPGLQKQSGTSDFSVTFEDSWKVNGYPIASLKTCFTALTVPKAGTTVVSVAPSGFLALAKRYALNVAEPPKAQTSDFVGKTLSVTRPVEITLSGPDEVFNYKLKVGGKTTDCDHHNQSLFCPIDGLDLIQGETFDASLIRFFEDEQIDIVGAGQIKTLRPITLVSGSVADGQTVYDKPTSFVFEYDKELDRAVYELTTRDGTVIESSLTMDGKKLTITPKSELARNAEFTLTLKEVEGKDGSSLDGEYIVHFAMSGGPKVTGISVNTTAVAQSGTITVTFDQPIVNLEAVSSLVAISGLSAGVTGAGNKLTINYSAGICTDFSILVKKGFKNASDIAQGDDWSFGGRTLCYTIRTIGYSRHGRAINAFVFGSGSKTVLYTGAIHGNEQSSRLLMNAWINELDVNARSIPAGTRIVVIPSVNPDGVAANSRYNAVNVDLNRNYDTSDWQKDTQTVNGDPLPGGGGSSPGSEPETQALMAYTQELAPSLTMSYHSSASYAIANQCGNSASLASTYAQLTGYSNMTGVSGAFSYQITGTYDDWICERLGRASVLIELATSTNAEFSRNKAALWAMAKS
jgi:predicted deacylase